MSKPLNGPNTGFDHGYYSGSGYTYKAFPEFFPQQLSLVCLLSGMRPPRLDQPFRLVDLGCGQGVGLCIQAALHPAASFCGIDLLPSHISHGRHLASASGLANVSFLNADLIALAESPGPDLPVTPAAAVPSPGSVDIAVCHGLLSWVNPEVQEAIWRLSSSCLRPGGLLALSYNALPGSLSAVPFQHLVRSLQNSHAPGPASLEAAIALSQRLQQCDAGLFHSLPALSSLLEDLPSKDPDYLPHEYNQTHWQPRFSDAVIHQAAGHGLSFLAGALPCDAFEGLLPAPFRDLLAEQDDPARRQLLRDLLLNTSFRRDVYALGMDRLWPLDAQQALGDLRILRLISAEQLERSQPQELFRFQTSSGTMQGNPDWFGAFLMALGSAPQRLADLIGLDGVGSIPLPDLLQNLSLLLTKGLVAQLAPPVDHAPSQRLNRILASRIRSGAPYRVLAAPLIGSCLTISDLEGLILAAHLDGHSDRRLVAAVDENLRDLGRGLEHNGRRLEDDDHRAFLRHQINRFHRVNLPRMQCLGAVA